MFSTKVGQCKLTFCNHAIKVAGQIHEDKQLHSESGNLVFGYVFSRLTCYYEGGWKRVLLINQYKNTKKRLCVAFLIIVAYAVNRFL